MFRLCNKKYFSSSRDGQARRDWQNLACGADRRFLPRSGGLTLVELLLAMSLLVLVAGTLAGLARTSQQEFEYTEGYGAATQHARVAIDRIAQTIYGATANEQFPGCLVIAETINSWRYPDTLVVWHPSGTAAAPNGLPLYSELVIYCPHPSYPNQLVEITAPSNTSTVPAISDTATWQSQIAAIKTSAQSNIVNLTNIMRTCPISTASGAARRGAVRFETRLRPSQADWNSYKGGSISWADLAWVRGLYGWRAGMRQVWVRMELQLLPQAPNGSATAANQVPVCFFGSAALYYQMRHQ